MLRAACLMFVIYQLRLWMYFTGESRARRALCVIRGEEDIQDVVNSDISNMGTGHGGHDHDGDQDWHLAAASDTQDEQQCSVGNRDGQGHRASERGASGGEYGRWNDQSAREEWSNVDDGYSEHHGGEPSWHQET